MEVNTLTFKVYKYLEKKGWKFEGEHDDKFIIVSPSKKDGFPKGFKLFVPIDNKSIDFGAYMEKVINFIQSNYPHNNKEFEKIELLNNRLKNRFNSKKHWIEPEFDSQIEKIDKYFPYFPNQVSWL